MGPIGDSGGVGALPRIGIDFLMRVKKGRGRPSGRMHAQLADRVLPGVRPNAIAMFLLQYLLNIHC